MATVFLVLKVIGHILLVILAVVLILLLLILFWPVCYDGSFRKHGDEIHAEGRLFWLFHVVHASGKFDRSEQKTEKEGDVRILGISLLKRGKKKKGPDKAGSVSEKHGRPSGRKADGSARKKPVVEPGQWKYMPGRDADRTKVKPGIYRQKKPNAVERLTAKLAALIGRLKKAAASVKQKIGRLNDWLVYLFSDAFRQFLHQVIHHGGAVLRHILPDRVTGSVEFGTGDPASTGEVLGAVAACYAVFPKGLKIRPDFQEKKLEADVRAKGHFFLIVVLVHALFIVLRKEFRHLLRRIRSERSGSGKQDQKHQKKDKKHRQETEKAAA